MSCYNLDFQQDKPKVIKTTFICSGGSLKIRMVDSISENFISIYNETAVLLSKLDSFVLSQQTQMSYSQLELLYTKVAIAQRSAGWTRKVKLLNSSTRIELTLLADVGWDTLQSTEPVSTYSIVTW